MEESKVLYTANEGQQVMKGIRIPRWVDVLTCIGVVLTIVIVLGSAASTGDPTAILFVQKTLWVMSATVGVFVLMLLINWLGWKGWLALLPLVFLVIFWLSGIAGGAVIAYWTAVLTQGTLQALKFGVYGFVGLAGLGFLARAVEKVGVAGLLLSLAGAVGLTWWVL